MPAEILLERPMFPHTVDSTMLSTFRSCPRKMYMQYVQHWKPMAQSVHLVAGGAFASGVEAARMAFYSGLTKEPRGEGNDHVLIPCQAGDQALAQAAGMQALIHHYGDFQCPPESAKSLERMCGALEFYFDMYPLGADGANPITLAGGRRGIEFSFAEPLAINHPVTGDPILYTGRADMLAERAGSVYVYDEKTTTSLGAQWAKAWEMRSQFTGYEWAAKRQGIKTSGSIIRGVSILKTKYDTLEVATYRSAYEIDRWEEQAVRDIQRMLRMWNEGYWDFNLDGACTEYGGCSFLSVCKSSDPNSWLPVYFEQRVWDPLARKELSIQEYEASWNHERVIPLEPVKQFNTDSAELQNSFKELMGKR